VNPAGASAEYRAYCADANDELISKFDLDGLYYDDNGKDVTLLSGTVDVAHSRGSIVMNHHSANDMDAPHYSLPDYWLTGESTDFRDPYEYFRRRQSKDANSSIALALSNENWNSSGGWNRSKRPRKLGSVF
jgi:hypothetical protein